MSTDFKKIIAEGCPLIDVRAPIEFTQGHIPGAINAPILNNDERALIGTTYKEKGQEAAVALGFQIISGDVKQQRIHQWIQIVQKNPKTILYCFRGGKRSQISQQWLKEAGYENALIEGGYKKFRQFLIDEIKKSIYKNQFLLVSGPTGSGKTEFLSRLTKYKKTIDLEKLAHHRGSAFGYLSEQPSQANFENNLAKEFIQIDTQTENSPRPIENLIFLEDESRLIGRCITPPQMFEKMRSSPVIWIDEPLETRVDQIFIDYIEKTPIGEWTKHQEKNNSAHDTEHRFFQQGVKQYEYYQQALLKIKNKLGGLRFDEIQKALSDSRTEWMEDQKLDSNRAWIASLLKHYYDPLYLNSLSRRQVRVLFRGNFQDCLQFAIDKHADSRL